VSHYVECKPGFKDQQALIEALVAVGFSREQIEVHEEAVPLFGYQGDERPQRGHIVIRREHVGQAANDVGWERHPVETQAPAHHPRVHAVCGRAYHRRSSKA
jgi:hypothetical protein